MASPYAPSIHLHTSKRMHFIEDHKERGRGKTQKPLHTSKRMHFIEDDKDMQKAFQRHACIRQNVCTSLRNDDPRHADCDKAKTCIRQNVCTSLRKRLPRFGGAARLLAYVKTYALH